VDFPSSLAEIVLNHHEWMDGSGYPQGLRSADIPLETRILAVSDVVEAIASYRPYRPAMDISLALDEVEKKTGILYYVHVVEACLRLFRDKEFKLEATRSTLDGMSLG
jgi:HD-GYP domain-containing protein (c-di-GMP phosphodiesterase class II)